MGEDFPLRLPSKGSWAFEFLLNRFDILEPLKKERKKERRVSREVRVHPYRWSPLEGVDLAEEREGEGGGDPLCSIVALSPSHAVLSASSCL
jgi:hypothetical protein